MHSITIRMGAANWDAVIHNPRTRFNFRVMTTAQRKKWYGQFMASVRKMYRRPKKVQ